MVGSNHLLSFESEPVPVVVKKVIWIGQSIKYFFFFDPMCSNCPNVARFSLVYRTKNRIAEIYLFYLS